MTTFPNSPRVLKGGIVLLDPDSSIVERIIPLQYNPDTLTRTLQVKGVGAEAGDRRETQRLIGPPVETIKLDAEIDATDQLELPERNPDIVRNGIHAQLAALESIVYPGSADIQRNDGLARVGTLEITPVESPLTLFVWSKQRIVPVLLTEFSITEEAFDPALNPIRAKVSLGMRVLSVNDLPFGHRGSSLFMAYHQQKERLAAQSPQGTLQMLGLTRI
jgi:hypothetical protein